MEPQINAITIAAQDIQSLKRFYNQVLEWKILAQNEKVVMFRLNNTILTVCTIDVFTDYAGMQPPGKGEKNFYLTVNLDSPKRVDQTLQKLAALNVDIVKMPKKAFWGGYSGFFADPEGNRWEVCYNPTPNKII
ncbi:VOC family protein [Mucilaginibacter ginsenosidivorans]|uniref:VOC family protein n=1 Tax=Mucilaginibacter ginsenosidivorans TaxID=398053 RepID=A0A5B8UVT5_9SPHI|nr:VOC family protein [Mucilaginibacter ginsenosidivorans]QEC63012.1 VOC family protein [Mucilaginibacter ginsenosidivorans]